MALFLFEYKLPCAVFAQKMVQSDQNVYADFRYVYSGRIFLSTEKTTVLALSWTQILAKYP